MGDNEAYSTFEHVVLTLYKHGVLTPELLDEIAGYWRGRDIDEGGRDSDDITEICVKTIYPDFAETYHFDPDNDEEWNENRFNSETYDGKFTSELASKRWRWAYW